jgi:disulfide bond formation protein DsbB
MEGLMSQRMLFFLGFLGCVVLIGIALYFQHGLGLEPCPLCILQRVAVMGIGLVLLVAAVHNPAGWGRRVYAGLAALVALAGLATAGRNVWLQHLPADKVPDCGPGLDYMLEAFPLSRTLEMVFKGSGECAEIKWSFLGFSIPEWMLLVFSVYLLAGIYVALAKPRS